MPAERAAPDAVAHAVHSDHSIRMHWRLARDTPHAVCHPAAWRMRRHLPCRHFLRLDTHAPAAFAVALLRAFAPFALSLSRFTLPLPLKLPKRL